jgi:hypothetical protein
MKKILLFIFICTAAISFVPVDTVVAQEGLSQMSQCSGTDCSACNVVHLANGIIKWLIGILFVIFAILVAVAGVKLVVSGGNHHALDEAKGMFLNAIIGFIIILSAWLIVDTIMRALVGTADRPGQLAMGGAVNGYLFWSEVQCQRVYTPTDNGTEELNFQPEASEDISMVPTPSGPVGDGVTVTGANCPVPSPSGMVAIPGASGHMATPATVRNFVAMRSAAAAAGITLTVTSSYRSEAKQVSIWVDKGCDTNPLKCKGKAARPCTRGGNGSNHNSGVALDISVGSSGSATFNWLKANGGRYGFYNNLTSADPFHWSPSGR